MSWTLNDLINIEGELFYKKEGKLVTQMRHNHAEGIQKMV
jgi:hypothetical protein